MANAAPNQDTVLTQARGRCECTGQCGENHQWLATQPPKRCAAVHGSNIQRKKDNPSCWVLSTLQGFEDRGKQDPHPGPRTAPEGEAVTRGVQSAAELAYPEFYRERVIQVWLQAVRVGGATLALCQRCRILVERKAASR